MQNHKRCNDDQDALKNSREIFGLGMSECDISIRRVVTPICDAHGRGLAVAHQTTGLTSAVFATQLIELARDERANQPPAHLSFQKSCALGGQGLT